MKNLVLAFALLATSASAQETPKVSTSIYCFKYAKGLEDVFVQTGAKKFTKVELSTANMLGPIGVVSEDGNITVRREEIDDEGNTGLLWFLCLLPMACLIISANNYEYHGDETIMVISFIVTAIWILVLVIKAFPIHRQIQRLENVVGELLAKEKAEIDGNPADPMPPAPDEPKP